MIELDRHATEEWIARLVDDARQSPNGPDQLVALLAENLPLYEGRSSNEVTRIRGYILAAFEETGLPAAGLGYVLEELESGYSPYLVAAAAKALRGSVAPGEQLVPYLLKAVDNVRDVDDAVSFGSYQPRWPTEHPTTALAEIFRTFAWLGHNTASALPHLEAILDSSAPQLSASVRNDLREAIDAITADESEGSCCGGDSPTPEETAISERLPGEAGALNVAFEDQDGAIIKYEQFFTGKPAVVAFFYTRCDNPNKCSLTIAKLGQLQGMIGDRGLAGAVKTAAITYDPEYDLPTRMKAYGADRGLQFTDYDRMFRATARFADLREYFELGVNFSRTTVNRHRIELFVLDREGHVSSRFTRLQWELSEVVDCVLPLLA